MTRYDQTTVQGWLDDLQRSLAGQLQGERDLLVVGIRTAGVNVARWLLEHQQFEPDLFDPQLGQLNIAFYRDDFSTLGLHPVVGASELPVSIETRHVVLVDDVLSTGRTIRAAMNALFDYGRPARITLAVLLERADHELPIRADAFGARLEVPIGAYLSLNPDDWTVTIEERGA